MKKIVLTLLLAWIFLPVTAQIKKTDSLQRKDPTVFNYKALIAPVALVTYGVVALESHTLKDLNTSTKGELNEHIDDRFTIDDFSQHASFVAVYALNAANIPGRHRFTDRTIILSTAYLIMGTSVTLIKKTGNVTRPDGSSTNSFPSGHTATAFMGAEFLYQEYKDQSIWYGITGYAVAAGTGFFRMYNDRHWLNDVVAGAGIGILSTKIAYWLHPFIKKTLFKNKSETDGVVVPYVSGDKYGVGVALTF